MQSPSKSSICRLQCDLHDQTGGFSPPVFFGRYIVETFRKDPIRVALQQIVEETVTGLGYDLVEIERTSGGLLRITIDWPWQKGVEPSITVEDCEKVNRQLQFSLEVDGVEYNRLEISSPGIDRPLRNDTDFKRFVGYLIDITLKAPMGEAAAGLVNASRKKFRGTLEYLEGTSENDVQSDKPVQWQVVWTDAPEVKPGQRVSKKRVLPPLQALGFTRDELREARLAPVVDFKGRKPKLPVETPAQE
jgi:ribosome maturation factor RimP